MDGDTGIVLLVVLLGGVVVWYVLNQKPAGASSVNKAPCVVGGSYGGTGISLPCSFVSGAVQELGKIPSTITQGVSGILGGGPPSDRTSAAYRDYLQRIAQTANSKGVVAIAPQSGSWRMQTSTVRLGSGQSNVVGQLPSREYFLQVLNVYQGPALRATPV